MKGKVRRGEYGILTKLYPSRDLALGMRRAGPLFSSVDRAQLDAKRQGSAHSERDRYNQESTAKFTS